MSLLHLQLRTIGNLPLNSINGACSAAAPFAYVVLVANSNDQWQDAGYSYPVDKCSAAIAIDLSERPCVKIPRRTPSLDELRCAE